MIDFKLWAQAQQAAGIEATEEQVHACYEQLLQEQDVVRAKGAPRVVNDAVMATWSDAARKAAAEARHNGIHGETVKPGEMVKFHTPGDEHEATHHMHVVEDRGDRVLVQHNSGFEHMTVKPQSVVAKADLMHHKESTGHPHANPKDASAHAAAMSEHANKMNKSSNEGIRRSAHRVAERAHSAAADHYADPSPELDHHTKMAIHHDNMAHGEKMTASEILAQKRAEIIRAGAPVGNKNAAGHGHVTPTAYVCPNCKGHYPSLKAKTGNGQCYQCNPKQTNSALSALRHHVSGAIERGEKQAIAGIPAKASDNDMDADVVRCRAQLSTTPVTAQDKPWKQGEPVTFTYMPAGLHTITAGFRKGSVNLTVLVDEDAARAAQRSYDAWRERMPKQKLYGCVEHREQEASVIASGFSWKDGEGVVISAEPTALGEQNVNGKIHWGWSPSFMTDADYSKAVERPPESGQLVFPDGVRGSGSNPARITGISRCVGTLTNNPAFHEMPPVKASEVVQAGAQPGNHNADGPHKHAEDGSHPLKPGDKIKTKFGTKETFHSYNKHGQVMTHESGQGQPWHPANVYKASDATDTDSVQASGTSEGVTKSWEARHGELMGKSTAHQAAASAHETNAEHHDDLNNGSLSNHHAKIAQHHQSAAEHYEEAAEHAKAGNDEASLEAEDKAQRHAGRAESMKATDATLEPDKVTASSILQSIKDRAVRASEILRPKFMGRLTDKK